MIVDDYKFNVDALKILIEMTSLGEQKHTISIAFNGLEAVNLIKERIESQ